MTDPIALLAFTVPGTPLAKGSLRIIRGRPLPANPRLVDWQDLIAAAASDVRQAAGLPILEGPLAVIATFQFTRPRGHYGTGRNAGRLRRSAPDHHTKRPDIDKLVRAVLDACKGQVWRDDSQVVELAAAKRYGIDQLEVAIQTAHAAGAGPPSLAVGGRAQPARDNPQPIPLHIIHDHQEDP